jgi:tripartite-type tricarboxylate transporter receptor subunit TctC
MNRNERPCAADAASATGVDHPRRRALAATLAGALVSAGLPAARARSGWPDGKTIRIVIPAGAGAGSDIFTRVMAEYFASELGTNVLVENKPGATGMLAGETVARAPADGLTLLVSFSAAILGNTLLMKPRSFEPLQDLTPIGRIGVTGNVLLVHPDVPAKSVKELVDHARARKGELNYASWGVASGGHLAMETVKRQTGMMINHVPYKSVSQIAPDLIAGVVPVAWIDAATGLAHIRSGRVRAIAVTSSQRMPQLPDVATLAEQGLKYDAHPVFGLFGPKGMPTELVQKINELLNQWLVRPQTIEFFAKRQNMPRSEPLSAEQFAKSLQDEMRVWTRLVQDAGFKPV